MWVNPASLVIDWKVTPRTAPGDFRTALRYADAMRNGDVFPPVRVGKRRGKLVVIDGIHRVKGARLAKIPRIKAIIDRSPPSKWYLVSLHENTGNGLALSQFERRRAIVSLREKGVPDEVISQAVRIPLEGIEKFLGSHTVMSRDGQMVALKAPIVASLAARKNAATIEAEQEDLASDDAWTLVAQVVALLKGGYVKPKTQREMSLLHEMLEQVEKLVRRVAA